MKKIEKNVGKTKRKSVPLFLSRTVLSGSRLSLLEIMFSSSSRDEVAKEHCKTAKVVKKETKFFHEINTYQ